MCFCGSLCVIILAEYAGDLMREILSDSAVNEGDINHEHCHKKAIKIKI